MFPWRLLWSGTTMESPIRRSLVVVSLLTVVPSVDVSGEVVLSAELLHENIAALKKMTIIFFISNLF